METVISTAIASARCLLDAVPSSAWSELDCASAQEV